VRRVAGVSSVVRVLVLVAVLTAGLSACGGSSRAGDAADEQGEAAAVSSTTVPGKASGDDSSTDGKASAAGKGKQSGSTGAASGGSGSKDTEGSAKSETTPTTEDPFRMTLPLTAEVAEKCVRPGSVQSITIRAPKGSGVGYQMVYSDGLQALMEGHYGGNSAGYTDEDGTFADTFTVAATAPPGPASANVLGSHMDYGFGEYHAHFAVADALGNCRPEDMD